MRSTLILPVSGFLAICVAISAQEPAPVSDPRIDSAPALAPDKARTGAGPSAVYGRVFRDEDAESEGSVYIPVDSWVYPAMLRLYSLGHADLMYISMRPYTRLSLLHIIEGTREEVLNGNDEEAMEIVASIETFLHDESLDPSRPRGTVYGTESLYGRMMGITGQSLRDSYHLGQTINNDYGRPYEPGFNPIVGFSSLAERGRFSLYVRGEYEHSPGAAGYSQALSSALSQGAGSFDLGDEIPYSGYNLHQATIPTGPIQDSNSFHLQEASLSFHILNHEISGGKTDAWLGPAQGGALAWSNNAADIYSFRINRIEPLYIPGFSWLFGTLRYDFMYGSLKGHTDPNSPYVHSEMVEIRPTANLEIGFQRAVIFGGEGHEPVTLHTFLRSFFSLSDTEGARQIKNSAADPGARFSDFSFSWRVPFVRKYATLLLDSFSHDDVSPISAPRRAAYRTGIYLSQFPGIRKLDFRIEAVTTDPGVSPSRGGTFIYYEQIQRQGYTNDGFIMGDWIGREAKGGQAWLTYHLSGKESVQVEYSNKKNEKDFIPGLYNSASHTYGPGGTTQTQIKVNAVKRFHHDDFEVNAWFQHEKWKAPIYLPGPQTDNIAAVQLTFLPALKVH